MKAFQKSKHSQYQNNLIQEQYRSNCMNVVVLLLIKWARGHICLRLSLLLIIWGIGSWTSRELSVWVLYCPKVFMGFLRGCAFRFPLNVMGMVITKLWRHSSLIKHKSRGWRKAHKNLNRKRRLFMIILMFLPRLCHNEFICQFQSILSLLSIPNYHIIVISFVPIFSSL